MLIAALVTKFLDHLQKLDYMGSSVNKYLVSFRAMVGYAYEDGLHNNDRALSCFSKRKVEESDKAARNISYRNRVAGIGRNGTHTD